MSIRINPKAVWILTGSFVVCARASGSPYFSLDYSQVSLPSSLFGWGLVLIFVVAAGIRITNAASFLSTLATCASVLLVIVMARVVRDTVLDPTSHNLWPFELMIACALAVPVALVGTSFGLLVRLAMRRWTSKGHGD